MKAKAHIISLGCPKNLTDSEVLMGKLYSSGYTMTENLKEADLIVVNTCAFLKSARKESMETIKRTVKNKKRAAKVCIAGCLPEYQENAHPSPSGRGIKGEGKIIHSTGLFNSQTPRIKATYPWTAYIKISEGCDNFCSYCLIPKIRGRRRNRGKEDIINEAKNLAKSGVKEIIYIAQDTAAHPQFVEILRKTAKIKGIKWIRIMYVHPAHLTNKLIKTIAKEKKIVKYIDLPIQHICDNILDGMKRRVSRREIVEIIEKLRRKMPGIAIRTSIIVGFPGETDKDFKELADFIKEVKFERLGVFKFSREKGTPAYKMRGQVPERVKEKRFQNLMALQKLISRELNKKMIGRVIEVLLEKRSGRMYIGRAYFDAPEIDGSVKASGPGLKVGSFIKARVKSALPYDLAAVRVT